jgi:hypothetical protein
MTEFVDVESLHLNNDQPPATPDETTRATIDSLSELNFDDHDDYVRDLDDISYASNYSDFGDVPYQDVPSQQLPVAMYDPYDPSFPRNDIEEAWGIDALLFLLGSLKTWEDWDIMIDTICDPFSDWDGAFQRTRDWFNALPFDVQMEVWIQRNLGLRPRSKWIMGPHDDLSEEWVTRFELGKCRIPAVEFPGHEYGYPFVSQYRRRS